MDMSRLSDEELEAIAKGDMSKLSDQTLMALSGQSAPKPETDSESASDKFHKIRERLTMGFTDPLTGALQNAAHLGNKVGIVDDEVVSKVDQEIARQEREYEKSTGQGGGDVDWLRVGGNAVPSFFMPGGPATRFGGAVLNGVVDSLNQPVTSGDWGDEKFKQGVMGGITGGGLHGALSAVSRTLSPNMANDAALDELIQSGVKPSLGQASGHGWLNGIEEKLSALPYLGDTLAGLRGRGLTTWNTATINKALEPIMEKVNTYGSGGVDQAKDAVKRGYDWALGGVGDLTPDSTYVKALTDWTGKVDGIDSADKKGMLLAPIEEVLREYGPGLTGSNFKKIDSAVGKNQNKYWNSEDTLVSDILSKRAGEFRSMNRELLDRLYPSHGPLLDAADMAYAGMKRVEDAASSAANNTIPNVFTPQQFMSAVRRGADDKSTVASGDALLQDWANKGNAYIRNRVPDSGTPARMLAAALDPTSMLQLATAGNLHGSKANDILIGALRKRPRWAKKTGNTLEDLTQYLNELSSGLGEEESFFGGR